MSVRLFDVTQVRVAMAGEERPAMCAAVLLDILEHCLHASFSEWLFLRELRLGTGQRNNFAQRLDAFALNCLPHLAMKRVCYEVKTSRADFLAEVKRPLKRRMGLRYSNEFYFVTPPGLLETGEVPVDCGLMEAGTVDGDEGRRLAFERAGFYWFDPERGVYCAMVVPALWRDTPGPTWQFTAAMLRNLRRQYYEKPPAPPKQQRLDW